MKINNRIVLDLSKAQYGFFSYKNQFGNIRNKLPPKTHFTVHGSLHSKKEKAMWLEGYENETLYDRVKRRGDLDVWIPRVMFQLTANHSLIYTGDKAKSLWKEWNRRIFNKGK